MGADPDAPIDNARSPGLAEGSLVPTLSVNPVATCRIYDVSANSWSNVGMLGTARGFPQLLDAGGTVVAIGGLSSVDLTTLGGTPVTAVETTGQTAASWSGAGATILPRPLALSVVIEGGQRILTRGAGDDGTPAPDVTAEIYIP